MGVRLAAKTPLHPVVVAVALLARALVQWEACWAEATEERPVGGLYQVRWLGRKKQAEVAVRHGTIVGAALRILTQMAETRFKGARVADPLVIRRLTLATVAHPFTAATVVGADRQGSRQVVAAVATQRVETAKQLLRCGNETSAH